MSFKERLLRTDLRLICRLIWVQDNTIEFSWSGGNLIRVNLSSRSAGWLAAAAALFLLPWLFIILGSQPFNSSSKQLEFNGAFMCSLLDKTGYGNFFSWPPIVPAFRPELCGALAISDLLPRSLLKHFVFCCINLTAAAVIHIHTLSSICVSINTLALSPHRRRRSVPSFLVITFRWFYPEDLTHYTEIHLTCTGAWV